MMAKGKGTAPAAFLAAAKRVAIQPGRINRRLCTAPKRDGTPCRMLAFKGCSVCGAHGGYMMRARNGTHKPSGKSAAYRATKLDSPPKLPSFDLMKTKAYRQADQKTRIRMAQTGI